MNMKGKSSFQLSDFSSQLNRVLIPNRPHYIGRMYGGTAGSGMLVKGIFLVLGFVLLTNTVFAQTPNFDQLKERFESGEVFVADFDHIYTDSYTKESTSTSGKIWIDQVRYKLQSGEQTIVVDGDVSRVYDSNRNRVIIDNYDPEDDDFAPSRMLSGIDSTYSVSERKEGERTVITLTSNDDFAVFAEVEILLDAELRPLRITAWDISDNEILTEFSKGRFLDPYDGLFDLQYPNNAEIVDMRY